jgi:hypothetical protein
MVREVGVVESREGARLYGVEGAAPVIVYSSEMNRRQTRDVVSG